MIIYNRTSYKELTLKSYQKEKRRLQIELLKLQEWVIDSGQRLAIVLEGRDAAGKGATIKRFIENLVCRLLGRSYVTQEPSQFGKESVFSEHGKKTFQRRMQFTASVSLQR